MDEHVSRRMPELDWTSVFSRHWDHNADRWCQAVRSGLDVLGRDFILPTLEPLLPRLTGLDVVEFGCGEGWLSRYLAMRGTRVSTIDLSPMMIKAAVALERAEHLGVQYFVARMQTRSSRTRSVSIS